MGLFSDIEKFGDEVAHYFLEGMKDIEKYLLPVAQTVVALDPEIPAPVASVVNALPGLMTSVEAAIPEAGSGPVKKAAVEGAVKAVCDTVAGASSGGQKSTWEKIQPTVSKYVDGAIGLINTYKPGTVDTSAAAADSSSGPSLGNASGAE